MRANSVQRNARCWNSTGVGHGPRHYSADQEDAKTVAKNFNGFNVADDFHLTSNMLTCEKDIGETMWPSEKRRRRESSYRSEGSTGLPKDLDYRTINPGGGF